MPPKRVENPSINSSMLLKNLEEMDLQSIQLSTPAQTPVPNNIGNLPDEDYPMSQPTTVRVQRPIPVNAHTFSGTHRFVQQEETKEPHTPHKTAIMLNYMLQCERGLQKHGISSLQHMQTQMTGAGKSWIDSEDLKYTGLKEYQMMARSERREKGPVKPTKNTFEIQLWPFVRKLDDMKSRTLQTAIVVLAERGCKICAGFGHGDTKCITKMKLKFFGRRIKILRQILKAAIGSIDPKGIAKIISNWPLLSAFHAKAQDASVVHRTKMGVSPESQIRADQISLYLSEAENELGLLSQLRCAICMGFGHRTSEKIRSNPREQSERYFCPTLLNIDERIESNQLAKQEWIRIKREVSSTENEEVDDLFVADGVSNENLYKFTEIKEVGEDADYIACFMELFVAELRCCVLVGYVAGLRDNDDVISDQFQVAEQTCIALYRYCDSYRKLLEKRAQSKIKQGTQFTKHLEKTFELEFDRPVGEDGRTLTFIKLGGEDAKPYFARTQGQLADWLHESEANQDLMLPQANKEYKALVQSIDFEAAQWIERQPNKRLRNLEELVAPAAHSWYKPEPVIVQPV